MTKERLTHHTHYLTMEKNKRKLHVIILKNLRENIMNVNQKGLKMNMKKTTLASAILLSLVLTGCGSSSSGGTPAVAIDYLSAEEVTALLTADQIAALEAAGLSAADLTTIIDGSTAEVVAAAAEAAIAAIGEDSGSAPVLNSVLINDTSSGNTELTFNDLSTAAAEGSLSVNVLLNSVESKLSYITLENPASRNDDAVIDLKMATSNNTDGFEVTEGSIGIFIRTPNGAATDLLTGIEFPGDVWANVELTWNKTAETVEIVVSDFETGDVIGEHTAAMNNPIDVASIRFKNGDSGDGGTTETPYYIDDFVLSDASGEIFENDFSTDLTGFVAVNGVALSDAENANTDIEAPVFVTELTADQTTDLIAAGVEQSVIDTIIVGDMTQAQVDTAVAAAITAATATGNQFAKITDTCGIADGVLFGCPEGATKEDTGELRYELAAASATGTVTFKMFYPSTETQTVKFNLFDSARSENSTLGQLRFDEGKIQDGAKVDVGTFEMDKWVDMEVTYTVDTTTLADSSITLSVDGGAALTVDPWNKNAAAVASVDFLALSIASNSGTADDFVGIDDFSNGDDLDDDFESYAVDTVLDSDNSDYNSSTFSVTVVAETAE